MLWIYPLVVSLVVAGWLLRRWRRLKDYWREKGVPHLVPHPLMGSLTFLQRQNITLWLRQLYKEMPAPCLGIWMFWKPALMINDHELCRQITNKDADYFRNRYLSSGKSDPIGALNIFAVNDPLWTQVRRRLTPLFTSSKLKSNEQIIYTKTNNLIARIRNERKLNKEIDMRDVLSDFTTDVVGESTFGMVSDSVSTGTSVMRVLTRDIMKFSTWRGLAWSSIFFLPQIVDTFKFAFYSNFANDLMSKIFKAMVEQRGGYDKPVTECRDLMDMLLKFKQDSAKANEDISEEILIAQAAIMLHGGFDTSSASLTYTLYHLAYRPELQERLYQEVVETSRKHENEEITAAILSNMPFLNAVLKESMRLHPIMGWLDRVALSDYQINDKLTIPAGMPVLINVIGMHYDPKYFPNPEEFQPDRFMPENEGSIVPYSYLPFGEGPRACIGRRFALQTMRRVLYEITRNFKLNPLPNYPKPFEMEVDKKGLFNMPGQKLSLDFLPRQ